MSLRIIPCLLLHRNGLVKSVKFKDYKYIGDPINAVKIFNEKEADEIAIIDISATAENESAKYHPDQRNRIRSFYAGGIWWRR